MALVKMRTPKGVDRILFGNYKFRKILTYEDGNLRWRCTTRLCNAGLVTDPEATMLIKTTNSHSHGETVSYQAVPLPAQQAPSATAVPPSKCKKTIIVEKDNQQYELEIDWGSTDDDTGSASQPNPPVGITGAAAKRPLPPPVETFAINEGKYTRIFLKNGTDIVNLINPKGTQSTKTQPPAAKKIRLDLPSIDLTVDNPGVRVMSVPTRLEVRTITSEKGNTLLVVNRYKYAKNHVAMNKMVTWWCCNKRCRSKVYTLGLEPKLQKLSASNFEHGHPPDKNIERQFFIEICKKRAIEEPNRDLAEIIRSEWAKDGTLKFVRQDFAFILRVLSSTRDVLLGVNHNANQFEDLVIKTEPEDKDSYTRIQYGVSESMDVPPIEETKPEITSIPTVVNDPLAGPSNMMNLKEEDIIYFQSLAPLLNKLDSNQKLVFRYKLSNILRELAQA